MEGLAFEWIASALPQLICGFVIGFLICYSGVGGGALIIPVLVVLFALPPSIAVGTASVYATATKVFAGAEHWRTGNINRKLCAVFALAAAPGVVISAAAVNYFAQGEDPSFQTVLRYLIAAAIIISLLLAQFSPKQGASSRMLPAAAFAVGVLMGATGIGGGVLIAPALLLLSGETPKRVVGASIIIALALSALTAIIYASGGQVQYDTALWMTVGSLLAIPPASYVLRLSSQKTVRRVLTLLILIALILLLFGEKLPIPELQLSPRASTANV